MKTKLNKKHRFIKIYSAIIILILLTPPCAISQDISKDKTLTREFDITENTAIQFENKVGDLAVETWDQNKVKFETVVYVKAGDAEDVETILEAISNLKIIHNSTQLGINTKFYENYISKDNLANQKITITLTDGTKVKLKELSVNYVLTIPASIEFNLSQKYENVSIPDLTGKVILEIYSCDLKAGNLPNAYRIALKYASADIKSLGDTKLQVYDSKLDIISTGNLDLQSKYSELNIEKAGNLNLEIYDDKVYINEHGNVSGEGKYTTLILSSFSTGDLALYDCTFKAGKIDDLKLTARYSKINLVSVRQFKFPESYDNQVTVEYIGDLRTTSKYTTFTIDELASSLYLNSYDDKVNIYQVNNDFSAIELTGKYTNLTMEMQDGAQYKLIADVQYTKLKYAKDKVREIRYHKEHSKFQYKGITKGANEAEVIPEIRIENYSGEVVITD